LGLGLAGALDVQDGRLQRPPEGEGLLGLAARARGQRVESVAEHRLQLGLQPARVRARRAQDLLPGRLGEDGEEQVLERQMGVAPRHRLAGGGVENLLGGAAEHPQASSTVARRGKPAFWARSWTVAALVSASSYVYAPQTPLPSRWTCIMMRKASGSGLWNTDSRIYTTNSMVV